MRRQNMEIAPWSFYGQSDPYVVEESGRTIQKNEIVKKAESLKLSTKNFDSQNRKKIQRLNDALTQKTIERQQKIKTSEQVLPSTTVQSPSGEVTEIRDFIIQQNQKLTILTVIKELLQDENKEKDGEHLRQKYECLFPILKPKETYYKLNTARRHLVRNKSAINGPYGDIFPF